MQVVLPNEGNVRARPASLFLAPPRLRRRGAVSIPEKSALDSWGIWGGAALLSVGSVAVWLTNLDRKITELVYTPHAPSPWSWGAEASWTWFYQLGQFPLFVLVAWALVASAWGRRGRVARYTGSFVMLAVLLIPLFTVSWLGKDTYGRPRPRQVVEFGGEHRFTPLLVPTFQDRQESFPSGHAAAGYALLLPAFALYARRRKRWAWGFLIVGGTAGLLLSATRVLQGGHFFSDVLWSAGLTFLLGGLFHRYGMPALRASRHLLRRFAARYLPFWPIFGKNTRQNGTRHKGALQKGIGRWLHLFQRWGFALGALWLIYGALNLSTLYTVHEAQVSLPPSVAAVHLRGDVDEVRRVPSDGDHRTLALHSRTHGRGPLWTTLDVNTSLEDGGSVLVLDHRVACSVDVPSCKLETTVVVPLDLPVVLE